MGRKEHIKAVIMLPGMVLIVIPIIILIFINVFTIGPISFDGTKNSLFQMHIGLGLEFWQYYIPIAVSITLICVGLALMIKTNIVFAKIGKGTLSPLNPTKKLVLAGLYKYVRNPMYIGVYLILLGESLLVGSLPSLFWALLFIFLNQLHVVIIEEKELIKRFGQEYLLYKKNVPRWLPRFHAWDEIDKN